MRGPNRHTFQTPDEFAHPAKPDNRRRQHLHPHDGCGCAQIYKANIILSNKEASPWSKCTATEVESGQRWDQVKDVTRGYIQQFIQRLFVEEVTLRLGQAKSERQATVAAPNELRNRSVTPQKPR